MVKPSTFWRCGLKKRWATADGGARAGLCSLSVLRSSIVSLFDTEEQGVNLDPWFRSKVEEAKHSEKPRLPPQVHP
jgi:hypothetical protein